MSLEAAVAGAARASPALVAAVLLVAPWVSPPILVAEYIERFRWIAWLGLGVILGVARTTTTGPTDRELGILDYI